MSAGLRLAITDGGAFARMDRRIMDLANPDLNALLEGIGSEVERQTRYRLHDEKQAPDGSAWEPWSVEYADSVHGRTDRHGPHPGQRRKAGKHTLLVLDGDLRDSIAFEVEGSGDVLIGSHLKYAKRQNAQRQYLGLSSQNVDDVLGLVLDFLEDDLV